MSNPTNDVNLTDETDLEQIERERAADEGMAPTGVAPEAGDKLEKGQELAADQDDDAALPEDAAKIAD